MDGPQMHRFAAGLPEHYKPHGNDGADKLPNQEAYGEQPVESLFLYQKPGAKQDNTFSQSSAVNQARGPGLLVNSTASIFPADNVYGRPLQQQRNPTAKQGDLTSDYRRPTKVIAVGKPAEYVNSYPQEQNRQGEISLCRLLVCANIIWKQNNTNKNIYKKTNRKYNFTWGLGGCCVRLTMSLRLDLNLTDC